MNASRANTEPAAPNDELQLVATWLARASNDDLETLLAATVAGDDYEPMLAAYGFNPEGWTDVGVTIAVEAVLWMASGAATPHDVHDCHDHGIHHWWQLRLTYDHTSLASS